MDVTVSKRKTKKTRRDRRIEKKEDPEANFIRIRGELFRRASKLTALTGAEMAIVIQHKKEIFSFGSPSFDAITDRYLAENGSSNYSSVLERLDQPLESMDLEELEKFLLDVEKARADLKSD